jgi:hypothetical protein
VEFTLLPPEKIVRGYWAKIDDGVAVGVEPSPPDEVSVIIGPVGPTPDVEGLTSFEFRQDSPLQEWVINHNLGRFVDAVVTDLAEQNVGADLLRVSPNQLRVTFATPVTGKVFIR